MTSSFNATPAPPSCSWQLVNPTLFKLKPTFKYNSVCGILLKEVSAGAARQSTVRSASKDSTVRQKGGRSGVLQDLLPKLSQVVENPSDPDQTHLTLPADSKLWCRDKAVKRVPPPQQKAPQQNRDLLCFLSKPHISIQLRTPCCVRQTPFTRILLASIQTAATESQRWQREAVACYLTGELATSLCESIKNVPVCCVRCSASTGLNRTRAVCQQQRGDVAPLLPLCCLC